MSWLHLGAVLSSRMFVSILATDSQGRQQLARPTADAHCERLTTEVIQAYRSGYDGECANATVGLASVGDWYAVTTFRFWLETATSDLSARVPRLPCSEMADYWVTKH